MKFLIIAQDLRVSGTSEGIVSRSFLAKLRIAYPDAIIDVLYLKNHPSDDDLHLLPINSIETYVLNLKIPFLTKWANRIYRRIYNLSLADAHIHKMYAHYIAKLDYAKYDHIFIRSAGLNHETILACKNLPILKKAIVNFHDTYPLFWYVGTERAISNTELFKMREMYKVVSQAKACSSSALAMSEDLEFLFGNRKKFYTLPHQYSESVFDFKDVSKVLKKSKKVMISYHGAIMFGRNIDVLMDSYQELIHENLFFKENSEFVVRLRGQDNKRLTEKYKSISNIQVLDCLNFSNSCYEQVQEASINIILENGPIYSNTLVGKAPFLASIGKPIFVISPDRSELRTYVKEQRYIANMHNKEEVKTKLKALIEQSLITQEKVAPFGDYFSDANFKIMLDRILKN